MAYDLRCIAAEKEIPPFSPAWKRWTALSVLVVGGGAFCVVSLWPAGESTRTPWFWVCVTVFPLLAWLVPFLFYLGALQSRRVRAIEYNDDRSEYIESVQREAGVALHVLASGFLFSTQDHENTPLAVTGKELLLEPRSRYVGDDETVKARWLDMPGDAWCPGDVGADQARHQALFRYVLHSLVAQIAPAVRSLPEHTRVMTTIGINVPYGAPHVESIWREAWAAHRLSSATVPRVRATPPELIDVDKWLDGDIAFPSNAVTILCTIHLNPLLNALPDIGGAEAGVILLLAPAALAARKRLTSQALLYRPEQGAEPDLAQKLVQALLWSRTPGPSLADHWFTGGTQAPLQRALTDRLSEQGVAVANAADLQGQHDLDQRIGDTGSARAWLIVALASTYASHCGRKQLVSTTQEDTVTLAVIAPRP